MPASLSGRLKKPTLKRWSEETVMNPAKRLFIILALCVCPLTSCSNEPTADKAPEKTGELKPKFRKESFGKTADQQPVDLYTLTNSHGMEAKITNYGGILVSLKVPDRQGKLTDVVLGYDNLDSYLKNNGPHFGATIGRYGNRIAKGRFKLNGKEY